MNGQWKTHVLLWIGSAIAISVIVGWTLVQSHNHPEFVTHDNLMQDIAEIKKDVRESHRRQTDKLDTVIQILEYLHGNTSRDSDY